MALDRQDGIDALVLESPAAIRPEDHQVPQATPSMLFAHPERQPPMPPTDPAIMSKQGPLVGRLLGPNRDPALEERLGDIRVPVLVLFGTEDKMIPSEMGRIYREKVPNCHFVLVYDAGHSISGDRPEAFTSVIGDFLRRHEQFVVNRETSVLNP